MGVSGTQCVLHTSPWLLARSGVFRCSHWLSGLEGRRQGRGQIMHQVPQEKDSGKAKSSSQTKPSPAIRATYSSEPGLVLPDLSTRHSLPLAAASQPPTNSARPRPARPCPRRLRSGGIRPSPGTIRPRPATGDGCPWPVATGGTPGSHHGPSGGSPSPPPFLPQCGEEELRDLYLCPPGPCMAPPGYPPAPRGPGPRGPPPRRDQGPEGQQQHRRRDY